MLEQLVLSVTNLMLTCQSNMKLKLLNASNAGSDQDLLHRTSGRGGRPAGTVAEVRRRSRHAGPVRPFTSLPR